jgi:hypothetical protein
MIKLIAMHVALLGWPTSREGLSPLFILRAFHYSGLIAKNNSGNKAHLSGAFC